MPSFEMGTMWSAVNPVPNRACIFLLLRLKKRLASTDGAEARRMPRALFPMLFRMWWLKQNGLQTERCLYRHPAPHPSERRMRRDLFKPSRCRPGRTFHLVGGVVVNRITFYNTNFPHTLSTCTSIGNIAEKALCIFVHSAAIFLHHTHRCRLIFRAGRRYRHLAGIYSLTVYRSVKLR